MRTHYFNKASLKRSLYNRKNNLFLGIGQPFLDIIFFAIVFIIE